MQAERPLELAHVLERELLLKQRIQVLRRLHRPIDEQQSHALLVVKPLTDLDRLTERVPRFINCFLFLDILFHVQLFVFCLNSHPPGTRPVGTSHAKINHHAYTHKAARSGP